MGWEAEGRFSIPSGWALSSGQQVAALSEKGRWEAEQMGEGRRDRKLSILLRMRSVQDIQREVPGGDQVYEATVQRWIRAETEVWEAPPCRQLQKIMRHNNSNNSNCGALTLGHALLYTLCVYSCDAPAMVSVVIIKPPLL